MKDAEYSLSRAQEHQHTSVMPAGALVTGALVLALAITFSSKRCR